MKRTVLAVAVLVGLLVASGPAVAQIEHQWGEYHWARTTPTFTLELGDNVTSAWDGYLTATSADWSTSSVLDTKVAAGSTTGSTCRPKTGRVEVCNAAYGSNNWLGLATVWAYADGHITQGTVKLNDTYFSTAAYNNAPWRNLVMCQEVGHTFGLGHINEVFTDTNVGSCMDYTNDPDGGEQGASNEAAGVMDFEVLGQMYAHLDSFTTVAATPTTPSKKGGGKRQADRQDDWGRAVSKGGPHGHSDEFEKVLPDGTTVITHVFWADHDHHHDH